MLLARGYSVARLSNDLVIEGDLLRPSPIGLVKSYNGPQLVNFKSYLPSKKVYLSRMTVRENLEPWGPFFEGLCNFSDPKSNI